MGLNEDQVCLAGDGVAGWGSWTSANGNGDSITAAANYPGGGGGKGYRNVVGTGVNNGGGGFKITFPKEMPEVWIRWYMRHQAGFTWELDQPYYEKDLYLNDTLTNAAVVVVGYSSGYFGIQRINPGGSHYLATGQNGHWQGINRGPKGDGQWHAYEVHLKMDTNGANGIAQTWIDGVLVGSYTNANFNGSLGWAGWRYFSVAINQSKPQNGSVDMYRDYDDFAISNTGYIGPIGGGGQSSGQVPTAPSNLRIAP